ncbi:MAG TPA: PAS domain-containing sensor histidine kinase [Methanomassiliicoccales archaeon]|nr:PAS domain-containing sensor histidine kinase [Methanomassiliicoccales archaeon]
MTGLREMLVELDLPHSAILNGIGEGIIATDRAHKIVFANKRALEMIGAGDGELNGRSVLGLIADEDAQRAKNNLASRARGMSGNQDYRLRRLDSTEFWAHVIASPMIQEGVFHGTIYAISDITDRRKAEASLRESEERFRQVANSSEEWIWEVDTDGLYIYSSPAVQNMLGYSPEEVVGHYHYYDFFVPSKRQKLTEATKELFAQGRLFRRFLNENQHRDGREVVLESSGAPIVNANGTLLGYRGADTDVTERERARAELNESELKFREIFNSANDGILIFYPGGRFLEANDAICKMLGYSREEMLAMGPEQIDSPESSLLVMRHSDEVLKNGNAVFETEQLTKQGKLITTELNARLIDYRGKPAILAIARDVTERRRAQDALKEAEKRLRRAEEAAGAGHWEIHLKDGTVTGSSGAMKLFGMDMQKATLAEIMRMPLPESRAMLDSALEGLINRGEKLDVRIKVRRQNDGKIVDLHGVAEFDSTKGIVTGIVHDMTEHQLMLDEIREAHQQLEAAMDIAQLAHWDFDPTTNTFLLNDRFYAILGTTAQKEGGYSMRASTYSERFLPPELSKMIEREGERMRRASAEGMKTYSKQIEHDVVLDNHSRRTVSITTTAEMDGAGKVLKIHGVVQDVTDRKRIELSLRRAMTRLELLNNITRHDVGNQLAVLKGNLFLLGKETSQGKVAARIAKMEGATEAIDQRLQLVRGQGSGEEGPRWQNVESVIESLPILKDVEKFDIGDSVRGLEILADPMLKLVFHNLLEDSVKYARHPTTARLTAKRDNGELLLIYEDEGPGIPQEQKDSIFLKEVTHTSGIGMHLCRDILLESNISMREVGTPGKGVRFEMLVPAGQFR